MLHAQNNSIPWVYIWSSLDRSAVNITRWRILRAYQLLLDVLHHKDGMASCCDPLLSFPPVSKLGLAVVYFCILFFFRTAAVMLVQHWVNTSHDLIYCGSEPLLHLKDNWVKNWSKYYTVPLAKLTFYKSEMMLLYVFDIKWQINSPFSQFIPTCRLFSYIIFFYLPFQLKHMRSQNFHLTTF